MIDNIEYRKAMEIAAYEEAVEAEAHLKTAMGHFVASDDADATARFAGLWGHCQECVAWMEGEGWADNG